MRGRVFEYASEIAPDRTMHAMMIGQLRRMSDELERQFGVRPRGAWLAERVWEPDVPTSLVDAGYQWTILDDAHFRSAAIPEDRHWGAYSTDDQGRRLTIFGTDGEDLYVYETNPANPNQYKYLGHWEPMSVVTESIPVKGQPDSKVELKFTRHGPVLHEDKVNHRAYALRAGWMFGQDAADFTAGAGVGVGNVAFDYAFVPYHDDLGSSHRAGLTARF